MELVTSLTAAEADRLLDRLLAAGFDLAEAPLEIGPARAWRLERGGLLVDVALNPAAGDGLARCHGPHQRQAEALVRSLRAEPARSGATSPPAPGAGRARLRQAWRRLRASARPYERLLFVAYLSNAQADAADRLLRSVARRVLRNNLVKSFAALPSATEDDRDRFHHWLAMSNWSKATALIRAVERRAPTIGGVRPATRAEVAMVAQLDGETLRRVLRRSKYLGGLRRTLRSKS